MEELDKIVFFSQAVWWILSVAYWTRIVTPAIVPPSWDSALTVCPARPTRIEVVLTEKDPAMSTTAVPSVCPLKATGPLFAGYL